MGETQTRGNFGEAMALRFLQKLGYRLIERGYTTRFGELDLIMLDGDFIVFVEVKTRKNADYGEAREFVSAAKQKRCRTTASIWLNSHPTDELQPRFDVVEVYAPYGANTRAPTINHLENAF
jgi:putative endonuclease